jgi:hypothetical protein
VAVSSFVDERAEQRDEALLFLGGQVLIAQEQQMVGGVGGPQLALFLGGGNRRGVEADHLGPEPRCYRTDLHAPMITCARPARGRDPPLRLRRAAIVARGPRRRRRRGG